MITAADQYRIDEIEANLDTRDKWTKEDFEDFYERDIKMFLGLVKELDKPRELVREVMGIGLTGDSKICVECQECCKWLNFILAEETGKRYKEIYLARGCIITPIGGGSVSLMVPTICPHLTPQGCDIYATRPDHCREYDGRLDPFMKDKCLLGRG